MLTDDTQSVQVTIQDFGCGMDEDTTAHMFDKFYQADTSHATDCNGLGLSLVRRIKSWQIAIVFLLIISFLSGISMTALTRRLILRPILNMLTPMQALAEGDFNMRIEPHGILYPKELVNISEQFNLTAKELGYTQMMRNDFINNFSHEFKTPIVSICGFARRLKNPTLSQAQRAEYADIIASEAERLASRFPPTFSIFHV